MIFYWNEYLFCFRFAFITQINIDAEISFFFDYYLLIDKIYISNILILRIKSFTIFIQSFIYTIDPRHTFFLLFLINEMMLFYKFLFFL